MTSEDLKTAFIVLFGKSCVKNPQYSPFKFQMKKKKSTHTQVWNDMRVDDDRIVNSG